MNTKNVKQRDQVSNQRKPIMNRLNKYLLGSAVLSGILGQTAICSASVQVLNLDGPVVGNMLVAGASGASMVGDTLTFRRAFPNISTDFSSPVSTTVVAGDSDIVILQPPSWIINPEANNITIDLGINSSMGGSSTVFDGIVITGFSNEISNASVITNVGGLVFGLEFGTNFINLNMNGITDPTDSINIQVDFVPEPSEYAAALGLGVLGFVYYRRRPGNKTRDKKEPNAKH